MGGTHLVLAGGLPQGTPHLYLGWSTPISWMGYPPPTWTWDGVPPPGPGMGTSPVSQMAYPPPPHQWWTDKHSQVWILLSLVLRTRVVTTTSTFAHGCQWWQSEKCGYIIAVNGTKSYRQVWTVSKGPVTRTVKVTVYFNPLKVGWNTKKIKDNRNSYF